MLGEDNKFNVVAEFISAYWIASTNEVSLATTEGVVITSTWKVRSNLFWGVLGPLRGYRTLPMGVFMVGSLGSIHS